MRSKANRVVGVMAKSERDWRAESDLNTLLQAAAIKRDPARFKAAQTMAKDRLIEMSAVAGGDNT